MHSLFRLLASSPLTHEFNDNARKLILENNEWKLWPILNYYIDTSLVASFKSLHRLKIPYNKDCFSRGQLHSKKWLIDNLKKLNKPLGTVYLCAGWYATLGLMLFESGIILDKIRSFDIDPSCIQIAEIFNKKWVMDDWKFKAAIEDIHNINYSTHSYTVTRANGSLCSLHDSVNTIINTSCEHIHNFSMWYDKIPSDKLVILQTNNYYDIEDHVNCSSSLQNFADISPMSKVYFEGELDLDKYTRFMRIGIK